MKLKIYYASDHDIAPENIDQDALYVVMKLKEAGYKAYLVGGSVRDLLANRKPKDFDVATSALPEEIKAVFRRSCILIGRRFRLAHVRFGKKIIEVSTFRSGANESDLIIQDNQWGTPEEDSLRRDFTINGLFYDPETHEIIDYVGGWNDIHKKTIKTIGDPETRFKQDPVRMLRLLKFQARFGFEIESKTFQALLDCREEIVKSSPARILEEMLRMLESGYSESFFKLMAKYGLLDRIFPVLTHFLEGSHGKEIYAFLKAADHCILNGDNSLDRSILLSAIVFPILEEEIENRLNQGLQLHMGEISLLSIAVVDEVVGSSFSHFPRKLSSTAAFILATQYRLTPLTHKKTMRPKILQSKEFSDALIFLKIRSMVEPKLHHKYDEWHKAYRSQVTHGDKKPHPHTATKRPHFPKRAIDNAPA